MKREDANGFWEYRDVPISCVGVYPYLGAHLPGAPDPTRVYMVFRPPEELGKPETVNSFKLQPWTLGHEMLGPEAAGLTPPEEKGIDGVIGEQVYFDEKANPPAIFANLKGFAEKLKRAIADGIKQVSAGYFHDVEWKSGVWNGQRYDAVQRNISGNHLASVPSGRMGEHAAVMDSLRGFDPNLFTLNFSTLEDGLMTLEELFEMLKGVAERLKALEAAKAGAASGTDNAGTGAAAGKDQYGAGNAAGKDNANAAGKDNDGAAPGCGNAAGKDEEGNAPGVQPDLSLEAVAEALKAITERIDRLEGSGAASVENEGAAGKDNAGAAGKDQDGAKPGEGEDGKKESGASMDAAMLKREVLRDIAGRDALAHALVHHVGTFDHSLMTEQDVAAYGCNKLGVPYSRGQESVAIRAYLKGAGAAIGPVFSMDAAHPGMPAPGKSEKMTGYLEGK